MQLLVQSLRQILWAKWNLVTKTYPKFVMLSLYFRILKKNFENVKKIEKIHMNSKKSINSFQIKKDRSPDYL